jgi:hypothetical protein
MRSVYLSCVLGAILSGVALPAYAYLDPGTGSMILQVILGGAAGVALAGKLYWRKFLEMIGVRSETPEPGYTEQRPSEHPPRAER